MTYIFTLLAVWFLVWLRHTYPSRSPKAYLKKLLKNHRIGFVKLEFDLYALKTEREILRREFDRLNESIDAYQMQVDNKNNKEETIKTFEDKIVETKKVMEEVKASIDDKDLNIAVYEKQMADLNKQKELLIMYLEREI